MQRGVTILGMLASPGPVVAVRREIVNLFSLGSVDAHKVVPELEPIHRRGPGVWMRVLWREPTHVAVRRPRYGVGPVVGA
jgi:hypothetical protein